MKFDVDDKNRCSLVCKISFKSVQVCGGCCKMFRRLTFLGHSVVQQGQDWEKVSIHRGC